MLRYCAANRVKVVPRGVGHGALRQRPAARRRGSHRHGQVQPHSRDRRRQPLRRRRARRDQPRHQRTPCGHLGLYYAPDPSSQIACTIGGNVAENSGGVHCLKYGLTTNNVIGVELVTIDGDILRFGGKHFDASGYDLLGVTSARRACSASSPKSSCASCRSRRRARALLIGFASVEGAGDCVAGVIGAGIIPGGMEIMDRPADGGGRSLRPRRLSARRRRADDRRARRLRGGGRPPLLAGRCDRQSGTARRVAGRAGRKRSGCCSGPAARPPSPRSAASRPTIIAWTAPSRGARSAGCCAASSRWRANTDCAVANVFHAGDGNLHPLILYDANRPGELDKAEAFGADILRLCVEVGGVLTGEHGVGVEKRDLMGTMFTEIDMNQQQRLKCAFDSDSLLNPGKVFPQLCRCAELGRMHVSAGALPFPDLPPLLRVFARDDDFSALGRPGDRRDRRMGGRGGPQSGNRLAAAPCARSAVRCRPSMSSTCRALRASSPTSQPNSF